LFDFTALFSKKDQLELPQWMAKFRRRASRHCSEEDIEEIKEFRKYEERKRARIP